MILKRLGRREAMEVSKERRRALVANAGIRLTRPILLRATGDAQSFWGAQAGIRSRFSCRQVFLQAERLHCRSPPSSAGTLRFPGSFPSADCGPDIPAGAIIAIHGTDLAAEVAVAAGKPLPTELAGVPAPELATTKTEGIFVTRAGGEGSKTWSSATGHMETVPPNSQ